MNAKKNTATSAKWTEERIRAVLASEPYDYQAIKLPFNLSTGGHDRQDTADRIFTGDWTGQSVVDVGASLGFFLFEAKRHGAGRCVGLDLSSDNVRRGSTLASILDSDVEFAFGDLDAGPLPEQFDNVLCLNVLHHLTDPILGINRLVDACRNRLVLEVATVGSHDRQKLGLSWLQSKMLRGLPAILVGSGTADAGIKQYYLTISAIENLLRYRRGCFARVGVSPSGFKNRFLVIAEKQRIENLAIIAAMPDADISQIVRDVRAGKSGHVTAKETPIIAAADYHMPREPRLLQAILDYDLMRPLVSGAVTYSHDPSLDLLETAQKRTVITLWEEPAAIVSRLKGKAERASGKQRKSIQRALENLSQPQLVRERYRDWLRHSGSGKQDRVVVRTAAGDKTMSAADWLKSS